MNKQKITQEEFDKKINFMIEVSKYEQTPNGNIDKERYKKFALATLKERYEIK